jgi:hypothetical protein
MTLPLILVFAHWLADFVCQTNRMATKKSEEFGALLAHVITYTSVMGISLIGYFAYRLWDLGAPTYLILWAMGQTTSYILGFLFLVFGTHLLTDYATSRVGKALFFFAPTKYANDAEATVLWRYLPEKRWWFFQNIGVDQLIHYVTLAWAFHLVFGS